MEPKHVSIVIWDDAHGTSIRDVTEADLPHHPLVMKTLGWVLRDDEEGVSIVNEVSFEDGTAYYRGHTFIPRAMVRSVTPFSLGKPRTKRVPSVPSVPANDTH